MGGGLYAAIASNAGYSVLDTNGERCPLIHHLKGGLEFVKGHVHLLGSAAFAVFCEGKNQSIK